jgi:hypothetical protein
MKYSKLFNQEDTVFKTLMRRRYVFLFGGLGNQLFQLAYAHHIAKSLQTKVVLLDATGRLRISRKFELELLLTGCNHGVSGTSLSMFSVLLAKFLNLKFRMRMIFKHQPVDGSNSEKFPIFSIGHYQDIKFIKSVEQFILSDLRKLISAKSQKSQRSSKKGVQLAAHIRRGDYDPDYHGHLSIDYYSKIFSCLDYDNLIVHTDDITTANRLREDFPDSKVYGPADATAWDVLSDLANSGIVVAANSTLSWWGAWLCVQSGGRAYLPSIWFRSEGQPPPVLVDGFIIQESKWD